MKRIFTAVCAAIVCCAVLSAPALAKNNKGNNGHGQGNGNSAAANNHGKDNSATKWNDRDVLRDYVMGHYKKNCPPGLAKKNPPCIPPGQAKKFMRDDVLPEGGWVFVPEDIVAHLTPPPRGARYVRMDKDVYLIIEGTRKVLDAIELFSQVD